MAIDALLSFASTLFLKRLEATQDKAERERIIFKQAYLDIRYNLAISGMLSEAALDDPASEAVMHAVQHLASDGLMTAATELTQASTDEGKSFLGGLWQAIAEGHAKLTGRWLVTEGDNDPVITDPREAIWHLAMKTREIQIAVVLKRSGDPGVKNLRIGTRFKNLVDWMREAEKALREQHI